MGVSGIDKHFVGPNAALFTGGQLGVIKESAGHHATIDHHDGQLGFAIIQSNGPHLDWGPNFTQFTLAHAAIDMNRQLLGCGIYD